MKKRNIFILYSALLSLTLLGGSFVRPLNQTNNLPVIKQAMPIKKALAFNGTYQVPLTLDLKMGQDAFSHTAIVEKTKDNVYLTFTQVDPSNLADMKLLYPGEVGQMVINEGKAKSYIYTVSEEDLSKPFPFSVIVTVMNKYVTFNMNLKLNEANYIGDSIRDLGERPARYIPTINTNMSDMELEKGTSFTLLDANATLGDQEIQVSKNVYYIDGKNKQEITVIDDKFTLDKIGEYQVIYKAESDLYKTSLGNNTKAEKTFTITSKVGASTLVKVVDDNKVLPADYQIQSTYITQGDLYDKVKRLMKKVSKNFEIFEVNAFDKDGNKITFEGEITLLFKADPYFNRNDIKVKRLNSDDSLTSLDSLNYGRYVGVKDNQIGTYIIYGKEPGFKMPGWGIALIVIGSVALVGFGTWGTVTLVKKKKKQK